ncbi:helix-turn-helix domain-containing protein [Aquisalimonas asiatica]|uniref:helix-turn-helix domain-containing protein n=1 Tax=Aquisalimonas asiatica TaxID=406100 RepID=UPI000B80B5D4
MHEQSLLTTQELAAYLGLNPGAIRTRLCRGQDLPPYIKLGREYRWRPADVDAWLENRLEYPGTQSAKPPRESRSRGGRPRNSSLG